MLCEGAGVNLGEPVAVVFRHSVYEGEILSAWTEAERERYYDADPEAREEFAQQAVAAARASGAPDIEVIVDGGVVWTDQ